MRIGVGRITLDFYNNTDVAKKSAGLEKLCADVRKKFNVSILEIDAFEDPEKCVLGFSATLPETWSTRNVDTFLEKIFHTIDESSFARVMVEDREVFFLE